VTPKTAARRLTETDATTTTAKVSSKQSGQRFPPVLSGP